MLAFEKAVKYHKSKIVILSIVSGSCLFESDGLQKNSWRNRMNFGKMGLTPHLIASCFLLIILLFPVLAQADNASLSDIRVDNTQEHLLLNFRVIDCFTEDMKEAIDNGINITFTFFIKVYEVKTLWWDKKIADLTESHDITYDSLKKIYLVRTSQDSNKTVSVEDFEKAKIIMSEIEGLQVADLGELHEGRRYKIAMMAELDKIRLPFYLHYVLFFLSLWDFETDWYTVDFKY